MIIEGKANRQPTEPVDPRKRLEFNEPEKPSRLPVYFALFITGIAAYLKSAFPAQSQDDASGPGSSPPPGTMPPQGEPPEGEPPRIDETTTGSIGDDEPRNTIAHSPAWDSGFTLIEPVSFSYTAAPLEYLGPWVTPFFPAAFNYQPQNDNTAPPMRGGGGVPAGPGPGPGNVPPSQPPVDAGGDDADEDDDPDTDDDDDEDEDDTNTGPEPGNRAPVLMGPVRLRDVFAGQVVLIGLSDLLFGATDPDGDILTINDITATGGTLVQLGAAWSFVTIPGMLGLITFTYSISDGLLEVVQTASLEVVRNTILLTPGDDVFVGTPWDDDIDGLAGDDLIDARAGNDVVVGGLGHDHINGGDGDDQLFGGLGDDIIFGGRGNDMIGGGEGHDRLFGEEGDDVIDGDQGNDILMGGTGGDILDGGEGHDQLEGEDGDDVLIAGAGDDIASGGTGNDVIEGNDGDDELSGNAGDDAVDGGAGNDTVKGAQGDDQLQGDCGDDTLLGGAGHDTLLGGEGDDEIHGGAGDDTIDAGCGDDEIIGDAGDDEIDGGDGHDILDYSGTAASISINFDDGVATSAEIDDDNFTHIEEIVGGQGDDVFVIGATAAVVSGGRGDDLFIFKVTDDTPRLSHQLVHDILDFVVGDRIHVADYEISRRAERLEEERFEELYDELDDDGFESGLIRITYAFYDDMDHTIIEADADRDDIYEIAIALHGISVPLNIDNYYA